MTARAEINDAQSVVAYGNAGGHINEFSSIIRPAMGHRCHHSIKRWLIKSRLGIY
jgi:hypothetical protein